MGIPRYIRYSELAAGGCQGDTATATLDMQLQTNPYLQLPTVEDFVSHRMQGKKPHTPLPPEPKWP